MTEIERRALYLSSCAVCHHPLIDHHEVSLRCQHSTKPHWWSRRIQCPCEMNLRLP
jgi:hypothetical protein